MMRFRNRVDAGDALAQALSGYRDSNAVIYALPRGGVVVGKVIARALHVPLDLVIARKIGHPMNPEYGIGAVSESGLLECNEVECARVDPQWFSAARDRERMEARRRRAHYLGDRASISATGKTAILADDGIATGLTMFVAIDEIASQHPREIIVAVPVIPPETYEHLRQRVDRVVAVEIPLSFLGAVGAYYEDFTQVGDDMVVRLLREDHCIIRRQRYTDRICVRH